MPELPDITIYVEALERHILGATLEAVRLRSPFLLRSHLPPLEEAEGRRVTGVERLAKRIVIGLEGDLFLVFHLMIAGRLRWTRRGAGLPGRLGLAAFDLTSGTLLLTEAGTKKRASLHVVMGRDALAMHDRGGLPVVGSRLADFREALTRESHTLKRALTNPRLFDGIGNAYSDEILHRAGLSPVGLTGRLTEEETARLHAAAQTTLQEWTERLRELVGEGFPKPAEVTAFRPEFAVHGRYREACPACGTRVQRIRYAANETNYCPTCQTGGKLLRDRSLSKLLKEDWPKTVDELEQRE